MPMDTSERSSILHSTMRHNRSTKPLPGSRRGLRREQHRCAQRHGFVDDRKLARKLRPLRQEVRHLLRLIRRKIPGRFASADRQCHGMAAGPLPSIEIIHFDHGPALASAETGLVRASPRAKRLRATVTLGRKCPSCSKGRFGKGGTCYFPGQAVPQSAGSVHTFTAGTERDLVFAVSHFGIEFM